MAVIVGTNAVTSIARHYIMPQITDMIYQQSPIIFRLMAGNKRSVQGGTQIEIPWMYSRMAAGGTYQGYDVLNVAPSDTIKNGALDWKQYYVPVTIDGLTMIKTDSPDAIANFIKVQFEQANMEMAALLGGDVYADASVATKSLDGFANTINNSGTYAGLARASNTWLNSQVDGATATWSITAANTFFQSCSRGGAHPTIIVSNQTQWNRHYNTAFASGVFQNFLTPGAMDEQLYSVGFTNILFNNVPYVVDSFVGSGNAPIYFLNEKFIDLVVSPRADFYLEQFQTPVNQDAMVAKLLWAGNIINRNPQNAGKMTAITA